jgi:hypothetical protein
MTALKYPLLLFAFGGCLSTICAQDFEQPPIVYSSAAPDNVISHLIADVENGRRQLDYDGEHGYLRALLKELGISESSQVLVFSQTSLQRDRISPRTPRAIYFNDRAYVRFCQHGDVLEISVADPQLGAVFYTLDQSAHKDASFVRLTDSCLLCHSSSRTENVPGHLVRSLFVMPSGQPIFSGGSNIVDHTTPFDRRWGGWYVTGTHGNQTHLGNLIVPGREVPITIDNNAGQNVTDLANRFSVGKYLTPHSDIVALMVLEHQTLVQNRITKANFAARQALHYQAELNRALGEPGDVRLQSTTSRIASAGEDLIEAILFVDEAELSQEVKGTSRYAEEFMALGPRDSLGRSLRDFDLQQRMFCYPCSYLIYSEPFKALPGQMKEFIWQRLWQILTEGRDSDKFAHLSSENRRAILEILQATYTDLPDYWKATN